MTPQVEELEDTKKALEDTHGKYKKSLEEVDHFSMRYERTERERNDLAETLASTEETLKEAEEDRDRYLKDFKQCRREKEAGVAYSQNLMMDLERTKAALDKLKAPGGTGLLASNLRCPGGSSSRMSWPTALPCWLFKT